jgi:hypothetical protein
LFPIGLEAVRQGVVLAIVHHETRFKAKRGEFRQFHSHWVTQMYGNIWIILGVLIVISLILYIFSNRGSPIEPEDDQKAGKKPAYKAPIDRARSGNMKLVDREEEPKSKK